MQFGALNSSKVLESNNPYQSGWAIAPPNGPLTGSAASNFANLPPQQSTADDQRADIRFVSFASQQALVAAARAGSGSSFSARHLDLLPQSIAKSGTVSGELTWSAEPINSTYKKLPPPSRPPMNSGQSVELARLPRELSDVFSKYDADQDGYLDEKEVLEAVKDMELMEDIVKSGRIPFSSFPAKKQRLLRKHDANKDEEIDVTEIIHGFEALSREKRRQKQLEYFVTGLLAFTIILLVGMSGMLAYIRRLERESDVTDSKMFVKDSTSDVVQTASALFEVKDGVLVDRQFSAQECQPGQQCVRPLAASQALSESSLSSVLSDEDLQELKSVKIMNGDSWIFFRIRSVARYREPNSRYNSVVVLYTHIGEIQLDGEDIFFHERVAGAFSQAGFRVVSGVGNNRRLLGLVEVQPDPGTCRSGKGHTDDRDFVQVIGVFNTPGLLQPPSEVPGANDFLGVSSQEFRANVTKFKICSDTAADCRKDDGSMPTGGHLQNTADFGLGVGLAMVSHEVVQVVNFSGLVMARTDETSAQYPDQTKTILQTPTETMHFQSFDGWNYHCMQYQDSTMAGALSVGGYRASTEPGTPSELNITLLGWDDHACGGVRCRKYRVEPLPDSNGDVVGMPLLYWEDYQQQRVYQMQFGNLLYRYHELTADVSGAEIADFEMREAWITCNPQDFNWPVHWTPGRVTDAMPPRTAWGKPRQSLEFGHEDYTGVIQTHLGADKFEEHLQSAFTERTVAEEQERYADYGGQLMRFCENSTRDGVSPDGLSYQYVLYAACDGSDARATRLRVWLDGESDSCYSGAGVIQVLRDGPTTITSGSLDLTLDVIECFHDQLDAVILDNLQFMSGQNPAFRATVPAHVTFTSGARDFYEEPEKCADGEQREMGYLPGAVVINGTAETIVRRMFETSVFEKELMSMDSKITVESLIVSSDHCGEDQTDSNIHIGFRVGLRWSGKMVMNLCRACADGDCPNPWRVCYPNQQPEQPPLPFDFSRQLFPTSVEDNCRTDDTGVYYYQCYHPAEVFSEPYSPSVCHAPIGFVAVPNTQCTPVV